MALGPVERPAFSRLRIGDFVRSGAFYSVCPRGLMLAITAVGYFSGKVRKDAIGVAS